jgi:hypothetical protein
VKRLPRCEEHHGAEDLVEPKRDERQAVPISPAYGWTARHMVVLAEALPPPTAHWSAGFPRDIRPAAIGEMFLRIANALATFWDRPDDLGKYLSDLLLDRRGRPKALPIAVPRELRALRAYYPSIDPDRSDLWPKAKRPPNAATRARPTLAFSDAIRSSRRALTCRPKTAYRGSAFAGRACAAISLSKASSCSLVAVGPVSRPSRAA